MRAIAFLPALLALAQLVQAQQSEPVDEFHPARDLEVTPGYGGAATIHLPTLPKSLNYMISNSGTTRWMLYEMHEFLVQRDWEHWDFEGVLAQSWDTHDTVILAGGRGAGNTNVLFGDVTRQGDDWLVKAPGSDEVRRVPAAEVESVERGTVFTFHLRPDVKWHDGHPFDADDVWFSWQCYRNPSVDCDAVRSYYTKLVHAEVLDQHTIRFFYESQYFRALETFDSLCILPSHLYNLRDPAHPAHDAKASDGDLGRAVNNSVHNTEWMGLGPYRFEEWSQQGVKAVRFPGYFAPADGGYLDRIEWRHIPNDDTAFQALINGELDFLYRLSSDDYFGEATSAPGFTNEFYKGYFYVGAYNYTPWNMRRPHLADVRVRKALAHAIDLDAFRTSQAHGLANLPTGPQFYYGPAYNNDVKRIEFDLDKAEELLAEAGWYDRDGDGIIDKDGVPFVLEWLGVSGNKSGAVFSQMVQESLAKLGIKVEIETLEWASYLEKIYDRDFDAGSMSWSVHVPESDPEQLWGSKGAPPEVRGSNHPGVADAYVDELIAKGQRELDDEARWATWRELHRYLYEEVQPYLFRMMPPRKFGMNKALRGFQTFKINPGYSIRRWFYPQGTNGTRAAR